MSLSVELERKGNVSWVWFRDPKGLNVIGKKYLSELSAIVEGLHNDKNLRAVVCATDARNFTVGLDLKEVAAGGSQALFEIGTKAGEVFGSIARLSVPTLGLFRGHTVGGAIEMGLGFDFRFACEDTKISIPGTKIGIFNPALTAYRLPRIIGVARAKELMILSTTINAKTALEWGLVSELHSEAELLGAGERWAEKVCALDSEGLRLSKKLVDSAFDLNADEFHSLEKNLLKGCFLSDRPVELMKNFWKK